MVQILAFFGAWFMSNLLKILSFHSGIIIMKDLHTLPKQKSKDIKTFSCLASDIFLVSNLNRYDFHNRKVYWSSVHVSIIADLKSTSVKYRSPLSLLRKRYPYMHTVFGHASTGLLSHPTTGVTSKFHTLDLHFTHLSRSTRYILLDIFHHFSIMTPLQSLIINTVIYQIYLPRVHDQGHKMVAKTSKTSHFCSNFKKDVKSVRTSQTSHVICHFD